MGTITTLTSLRRCGRACLGAVRSLSPTAVAVALARGVGGAGIADAANGGAFILGRANREASPATLANTRGTPLALSAPAGRAPLAVNRRALVKNLNAQFVGGLGSAQLESTGGFGVTNSAPLTNAGAPVVETGDLRAGVYYVTATASMLVGTGGKGAGCWIQRRDGSGDFQSMTSVEGFVSAAETTAMLVPAGGSVQEWCSTFAAGSRGSYVQYAAITAIRILSSSPGFF